jgi:hypothetical protein
MHEVTGGQLLGCKPVGIGFRALWPVRCLHGMDVEVDGPDVVRIRSEDLFKRRH